MLKRIRQFINRAIARSKCARALRQSLAIMGDAFTVQDAVRICGVSTTHGYWLARHGFWQVVTDGNGQRQRPMRVTSASVAAYIRGVESGAIRSGKRAQAIQPDGAAR